MSKNWTNPFGSEKELCDAFIAEAKQRGWSVYPETHGSDIFMVAGPGTDTVVMRPPHYPSRWAYRGDPSWRRMLQRGYMPHRSMPVPDGYQVLVEAKQSANVKLLRQAMPPTSSLRADAYVALAPRVSEDFATAAHALGITTVQASMWNEGSRKWVARTDMLCLLHAPLWPELGEFDPVDANPVVVERVEPRAVRRLDVPEYDYSDLPAGVPSPRGPTPWKLKAIEFTADFYNTPFTMKDMRSRDIDSTVWKREGWIRKTGEKRGRADLWELVDSPTRPDEANPVSTRLVYERRWAEEAAKKGQILP